MRLRAVGCWRGFATRLLSSTPLSTTPTAIQERLPLSARSHSNCAPPHPSFSPVFFGVDLRLKYVLMAQWGSWVVLHPLSRREQTDVWEASIVRGKKNFYTHTTHTHAETQWKGQKKMSAHTHTRTPTNLHVTRTHACRTYPQGDTPLSIS